MMDTPQLILQTFLPTDESEYNAYQSQTYSNMHDQMIDVAGYIGYTENGMDCPSIDIPAVFQSHGVFTDWELGLGGYVSNYVSVPRNA